MEKEKKPFQLMINSTEILIDLLPIFEYRDTHSIVVRMSLAIDENVVTDSFY